MCSTLNMLKKCVSYRNVRCLRATSMHIVRRTLLSEAYGCSHIWNQRLKSPVLAKVNINDFVQRLNEKLDKEGQICPLDYDIFANKLEELEGNMLMFGENLFRKFRHCLRSPNILESSNHAIIRTYLAKNNTSRLLDILKDKVHNGIFCDYYSGNLLMDHCIKTQNWEGGLQVASEFMLQEDVDQQSTWLLALYCCHMRYTNPPLTQTHETQEEDDEENWVRVKYIENPSYDDHFDVSQGDLLLGKTLAYLCRHSNDLLTHSYHLIGLALHEKFDLGLELLEMLSASSETNLLAQEALSTFGARLTEIVALQEGETSPADQPPKMDEARKQQLIEQFQILQAKLETSNKVADTDLQKLVINFVESELPKNETKDIEHLEKLYKSWHHKREEMLDREITIHNIFKTRQSINEKLKQLQDKEELVTYFDKEFEIQLTMGKIPLEQRDLETNPKEQTSADEALITKKPKTKWRDYWANYEAEKKKKVIAKGPPITAYPDVVSAS